MKKINSQSADRQFPSSVDNLAFQPSHTSKVVFVIQPIRALIKLTSDQLLVSSNLKGFHSSTIFEHIILHSNFYECLVVRVEIYSEDTLFIFADYHFYFGNLLACVECITLIKVEFSNCALLIISEDEA